MDSANYLITPMLQGFIWMDEGLQNYLRAKGWPEVTRPQSMVMANVAVGVRRPSEIARNLGVSRQAIHVTITQMVNLGVLELTEDPQDRRSKLVTYTLDGARMRETAQEAMRHVMELLRQRIGARRLDALKAVLAADWGDPLAWSEHQAE